MSAREPRALRPRRARAVLFLVISTFLVAIAIGALISGALIGLPALAVSGLFFVMSAFQLVHPRSLATRLDGEGFRIWNVWGRPVHAVPWERVAEFGVVRGNLPLRPGAAELVGFRCEPPLPGKRPRLQRRDLGRFDACLPDYYAGFDSTLELMLEYANEGRVTPARLSGRLSPL